MKFTRVICASLILPALLLAVPTAYGQSKKEQIAILNYRVDSLLQVLSQERTQTDIQTIRLNQLLNNSRRKSDSLYSLLWRATNNLQEKETRIADQVKLISDFKATQTRLYQRLQLKSDSLKEVNRLRLINKSRFDSLSAVVNKQAEGTIPSEELLKITRNNLENYSVDNLVKSIDKLTETRFYEDTKSTEFGVFEKVVGRLVFVRGFVSSGCRDCYGIVLNYYTSDGFLFHQEQEEACNIAATTSYTTVRMTADPKSGLKRFTILNGEGEQLNIESIKNSAATLKNFRGVPSGYRATGTTKPSVFQCVSPRGIE